LLFDRVYANDESIYFLCRFFLFLLGKLNFAS